MSIKSDVGIQCEEKAFELFKEAWEKVDFLPGRIYLNRDSGVKVYTAIWEYVKWENEYSDIKAIEDVIEQLTSDDFTSTEGYAFSLVEITENNDIYTRSNDRGYKVLDFCAEVTFNLPPDLEDICEAMYAKIDRDIPRKVHSNGHGVYFCPNCRHSVWQNRDESNYCFSCGQALSWDDLYN